MTPDTETTLSPRLSALIAAVSVPPERTVIDVFTVSTIMLINGWYSTLVTRDGQEAEVTEVIVETKSGAQAIQDALCAALRAGMAARMAYLVIQRDGDVTDVDSAWQTHRDAEERAEWLTCDTPKYPASVLPVKLDGGAL